MLKGNSFSRDSDDERTERLIAFSANISDVADELGLPVDKTDAAEATLTEWDDATSAAIREHGEAEEATEELNKVLKEAYDYYVAAKAHLKAVIYEIEYPDKIIEAYGFGDDSPTDAKGLHTAFNVWLDEHAVLVAEGDPRIVNDTIIAKLEEHFTKLDQFIRSRLDEKDEAVRSTEAKRAVFERHSKLLSYVHTLACLTWGDDASQLRLLGMVPSSEIWTPGSGEPEPSPEDWPLWPGPAETFTARLIEPGVVELVYSGVQEATIGWLHRRKPGSEGWILVADDLPMTAEDIIPFRDYDVPKGEWEFRFIPMRGDEQGEPSYAKVNVQ